MHTQSNQECSKETLVAVIVNIEGREWCQRMNRTKTPEHPRASTSDDVECFFSMMRNKIAKILPLSKSSLVFAKLFWSSQKGWIQIYHFLITRLATHAIVKAHLLILAKPQESQKERQVEYQGVKLQQSLLVDEQHCQYRAALAFAQDFTIRHSTTDHHQLL